jgi:hypothetical protein
MFSIKLRRNNMLVKYFKVIILFLLMSFFANELFGYDFNFDFRNETGEEVNDFHIQLKGQVTVNNYYTGSDNPFGEGTSSYMPFDNTTWISFDGATVPVTDPPTMIHIGFDANGKKLQKAGEEDFAAYWTYDIERVEAIPVGGCWYSYNVSNNRVTVHLNNDAGPQTITVYGFRYYVSSSKVPLNNLVWNSIPWTPTSGTYDLAPGGTALIPIYNVSPNDYVIFGWKTVWHGGASEVRAIFQEQVRVTSGGSAPTISGWSQMILFILLLASGIWLMLRKRRVVRA